METVHSQCSYEWEQYRNRWRQRHRWARPLALREPWGQEGISHHEGLSRKQSTILLHCRTGHIGLAAHLHRFGVYATDRCPFCGNGPHTVEHLFIHCAGRDCYGRSMPDARAALYKRAEGTTDLRTIFVEHPVEAAKFALKRFGIPQFTRASWQIKAARKRGPPAAVSGDAVEPAAKKRKYTLLDLKLKRRQPTPEDGTTG